MDLVVSTNSKQETAKWMDDHWDHRNPQSFLWFSVSMGLSGTHCGPGINDLSGEVGSDRNANKRRSKEHSNHFSRHVVWRRCEDICQCSVDNIEPGKNSSNNKSSERNGRVSDQIERNPHRLEERVLLVGIACSPELELLHERFSRRRVAMVHGFLEEKEDEHPATGSNDGPNVWNPFPSQSVHNVSSRDTTQERNVEQGPAVPGDPSSTFMSEENVGNANFNQRFNWAIERANQNSVDVPFTSTFNIGRPDGAQ
ncbi:hypothetical protein OGAPHI_006334 [Ogataea philodendri]|uniref:Uncharacterized protein n=1 Tax=Ogataea philodendri TaxID=1378263 RepID=A0A9P8NXQ6_9ASCO|nr:uncharacterized protein OGAPHI_006334 [Ogataea philodendri]KAH3661487.1 hypothetical protein OGAPHI_006334 [Ogataea philodendri]